MLDMQEASLPYPTLIPPEKKKGKKERERERERERRKMLLRMMI